MSVTSLALLIASVPIILQYLQLVISQRGCRLQLNSGITSYTLSLNLFTFLVLFSLCVVWVSLEILELRDEMEILLVSE